MIELKGLTTRQVQMADILWNCKTSEQVEACITLWGTDAIIVRDLLIAVTLDETDRVDVANEYLARFRI